MKQVIAFPPSAPEQHVHELSLKPLENQTTFRVILDQIARIVSLLDDPLPITGWEHYADVYTIFLFCYLLICC